MSKSITLHNKEIPYTLRRTRRSRSMRLSITAAGLTVSAHPLIPEFVLRQFIRSKADWIITKLTMMEEVSKKKIHITDKKQKNEIKYKAIESVLTKVKKWNEEFGFEINKIKIKEQKNSWGSCTRRKNLYFNWKLGLVSDHLVDYVVVHELCHLQEFNHGRRFWKCVESKIPDYRQRVRELKKEGFQIA